VPGESLAESIGALAGRQPSAPERSVNRTSAAEGSASILALTFCRKTLHSRSRLSVSIVLCEAGYESDFMSVRPNKASE
jgi:hypothetical protein